MKMVRPVELLLNSTNVPETPPAAWNSGTTYADQAQVSIANGVAWDVYESLQNSNTNHSPASSPTWWFFVCTVYSAYSATTGYADGVYVTDTSDHRLYEAEAGHTATVTISVASPGIITWTAHGLANQSPVIFSTTGTLPTGLTAGTVYYASGVAANTFKVSATPGGAEINTTGAGGGTHTGYKNVAKSRTDTTYWIDRGPTNYYAMFDDSIGTGTTVGGTATVPGEYGMRYSADFIGTIDNLTILNCQAKTIYINLSSVTDPNDVYPWAGLTLVEQITYEPVYTVDGEDFYQADVTIPLTETTNGNITVWLANDEDNRIGIIKAGRTIELGGAIYGSKVGIDSFSRKERDAFGGFEVTPRSYAKRGSFPVAVYGNNMAETAAKVDVLQQLFTQYRDTPTVWIGSEDYSSTIIYGFYRSFDLTISHPTQSDLTLEIEGLT